METNQVIAVNAMSYFDEVASNFEEFKLPNVLKSYYLTKCRISEKTARVQLSSKAVDIQKRCPRCCVSYIDSDSSYRIEPEQKKSKFARKLLKKQKSGCDLTKYQTKYFKRIKTTNQCVVKCGMCSTESKFEMEKPEKIKKELKTSQGAPKTKKKKKKKDKTAGLKIDANTQNSIKTGNNNSQPKETKKRKATALSLAFCSNKKKKTILAAEMGVNLPLKKSENSKKARLTNLAKVLNIKNVKKSPAANLNNFLKSFN